MIGRGLLLLGGTGGGTQQRVAGQIKLRALGDARVVPASSIYTPDDPFSLDLTPTGMTDSGQTPIVCGDDYTLRFSARTPDDQKAIDLASALIIMTWRKNDKATSALFARRSDAYLVGNSGAKQVDHDDQTVDNGPDGEDGMGWFGVNFHRSEVATMVAVIGSAPRRFDIRALLSTPAVLTFARGQIDFLRPDTNPVS